MTFRMAAAVSAAALLLIPVAAGAGSPVRGPRVLGIPSGHGPGRAARRRMDASTCSGTGTSSVVAGGVSNNTYGLDAGILAGSNNTVCDDESSIAGGYGNAVDSLGGDLATYSFIGAGYANFVSNTESIVGAGFNNQTSAQEDAIGAGEDNAVSGDQGFVGAGEGNSITKSSEAFIGSGSSNEIVAHNVGGTTTAGGSYSFIGGGADNLIFGSEDYIATYSAIAGGYKNADYAAYGFIGGGSQNTLNASDAAIGGGYLNDVGATASFSVIAGGNNNGTTGEYAVVGGGYDNLTKGADAVIPGGQRNEAYGELSFAAGYQAHALNTGSFVWSDYHSGSSPLADTAAGQFVVRASGGTYIYSNEADTAGVRLAAGSGTWASLSDRNAKTDVVPLDDASILAKVASLPVSVWRYKSERGVRHVGPMAQDFYAAFGVGEDDRHITSIDEDGVALAAIKALNHELRRENAELRLEARRSDLRATARIATLDERVARLDAAVAHVLSTR